MDDKNNSNLGSQISGDLQEGIRSGDFSGLKKTISYAAKDIGVKAVSQVSDAFHASGTAHSPKRPINVDWKPADEPKDYRSSQEKSEQNVHYEVHKTPQPQKSQESSNTPKNNSSYEKFNAQMTSVEHFKKVQHEENVSSGFRVTGYFFSAMMLLSWLSAVSERLPNRDFDAAFNSTILFMVIIYGLSRLILHGRKIKKRLNRLKIYENQWRGKKFCTIKELAVCVKQTENFVVKDIQKMIISGILPEISMDENKTCLIFDQETYMQYLETEENLKKRREIEERCAADPDSLEAIIAEGREYVRKIQEANNALPGEEVSNKLFRLEESTSRIFTCVEQHPEKLSETRRLLTYYLPTTLKLVNAYRDFEAQSVNGKNVDTAKKEILDVLDTINTAFEKLLDSLFQDNAMDISTDISALKTILAQEGLTEKDDFK